MLNEEYGRIFGLGKPNDAFAKYFIENSYLKPLTNPKETVFIANVTFESGCRNNWYINHATRGGGQIFYAWRVRASMKKKEKRLRA